jgi:hypothetical protein
MCVVVWVWRTLIAGIMIYGPRVLLHVDLREPPTLFLGVAQRRSVHPKKSKYFVLQKASPFIPDFYRMGDTPSNCLDADGLCR